MYIPCMLERFRRKSVDLFRLSVGLLSVYTAGRILTTAIMKNLIQMPT